MYNDDNERLGFRLSDPVDLDSLTLDGLITSLTKFRDENPHHAKTQVVMMLSPIDMFIEYYPQFLLEREEIDSGAKFIVISDENGY